MARAVVLDTETTGLDPQSGHRLIEVACVEIDDYIPTGRNFHRYIHPERAIDADAQRVHGISLESLKGKPKFNDPDVVDAFLEFVGDAPIVAHNAAFDRGFINHELARINRAILPEPQWIDTLALAKKRFPGMYNSLDSLCKRFKISLADRKLHGALIDASLLAQVYLELQGGRERGLELTQVVAVQAVAVAVQSAYGARPRPLPSRITDEERAAHDAFVSGVLKDKALWLKVAP
ncbi:MAG: DNA polymerase III subunit epsilon [Caulobacterales bacterium 68-7]|nr:MAG: DNA polymerase III subunit epsilon [Caulobacterales bacterium 68-7]